MYRPILQGFLTKSPPPRTKALQIKRWMRRWCVLAQEIYNEKAYFFMYFERKDSGSPINRMELKDCERVEESEMAHGNHKNVFSIYMPERVYHFSADTIREMEEWLTALREPLNLSNDRKSMEATFSFTGSGTDSQLLPQAHTSRRVCAPFPTHQFEDHIYAVVDDLPPPPPPPPTDSERRDTPLSSHPAVSPSALLPPPKPLRDFSPSPPPCDSPPPPIPPHTTSMYTTTVSDAHPNTSPPLSPLYSVPPELSELSSPNSNQKSPSPSDVHLTRDEDITSGILLLEQLGLKEEEYQREVTDADLEEFTHTNARNWRRLPPHLKMHDITVSDLERKLVDEGERRYNFFTTWHSQKGSDATYEMLVHSLVKTKDKQSAESMCQILLRKRFQNDHPESKKREEDESEKTLHTELAISTQESSSSNKEGAEVVCNNSQQMLQIPVCTQEMHSSEKETAEAMRQSNPQHTTTQEVSCSGKESIGAAHQASQQMLPFTQATSFDATPVSPKLSRRNVSEFPPATSAENEQSVESMRQLSQRHPSHSIRATPAEDKLCDNQDIPTHGRRNSRAISQLVQRSQTTAGTPPSGCCTIL